MEYLIVKWVHVVSSTILFGTGIGSAFLLLRASLARDSGRAAVAAEHVVVADWIFTSPAVVLQPASGFYLAHLAQLPLSTPWLAWSLILYLLAIACWLPVVWIQLRMRRLAREAAAVAAGLPPAYWTHLRAWTGLGVIAFVALLLVFYLMVAKPL